MDMRYSAALRRHGLWPLCWAASFALYSLCAVGFMLLRGLTLVPPVGDGGLLSWVLRRVGGGGSELLFPEAEAMGDAESEVTMGGGVSASQSHQTRGSEEEGLLLSEEGQSAV